MKYIKTFESYNLNNIEPVRQMLEMMSKFGSGIQQKLAKAKLNAMQEVECVSIYNIFDENQIELIKERVNPQPKECYANSLHTAQYLENVEYVEGYIVFYGLPIEHAFNKIDDVYFDVTQEIALNNDVNEQTYVAFKSWDYNTALMWMAHGSYQCYGDVFNKEFFEENEEKVK